LKSWTNLANRSTFGGSHPFEKLLYDDLSNHYPEIKQKIDSVQQYLDEKFPIYHQTRIDLVLKLFEILENTNGINQFTEMLEKNVTAALFYILDYDRTEWPSLYNIVSSTGMLDKIKKAVNQDDVGKLGNSLGDITKKSLSLLVDLSHSIDTILKYEGDLKGNCDYLL
jgi:hypothetical protein